MHLSENVVNHKFSHIYVEKDILELEETQKILSCFPKAKIILIADYRDVFNRKKQSHAFQKTFQNLILARKKKDFIYHASPVCQSFDNRYFYYSSSMMNCIYDCEYCFLKGMYPSANLVVFVNLEDFFHEIEEKLKKHPVYLCVSYDTDMLALENCMHHAKKWSEFAKNHKNLSIEIRTKGVFSSAWKEIVLDERIILAFTLSPQYVAEKYEHATPDLVRRMQMIQEAQSLGYPCRICFDPILVFPGWEKAYREMVEQVVLNVDCSRIRDFSVGSFRISKNYMSNMRKQYPESAVLQYPYVCENGFYQLPDHLQNKVENCVITALEKVVDKEKIFQWREDE